MKPCELCNQTKTDGMRYATRVACLQCIDKALEFVITAGLSFEGDEG